MIESRGNTRRVLLLARDVPSIGYRMLRALPGVRHAFPTALQAVPGSIENEFLKVKYNDSGALTSIYRAAARWEAVAGLANVLELAEEDPTKSSAWISAPAPKRISPPDCGQARTG